MSGLEMPVPHRELFPPVGYKFRHFSINQISTAESILFRLFAVNLVDIHTLGKCVCKISAPLMK